MLGDPTRKYDFRAAEGQDARAGFFATFLSCNKKVQTRKQLNRSKQSIDQH